MLIRIWRLVTLLFVALSRGVALAHLLGMPAKLESVVLAFLVRQRHPAFAWTLLAALSVVAAHTAFWFLIAPVNAKLLPLSPA